VKATEHARNIVRDRGLLGNDQFLAARRRFSGGDGFLGGGLLFDGHQGFVR
jgi:hypothetical protein